MKDLMIDLETMGKGDNAAIVSIGACFFDPATNEIGAEFEVAVDLGSSVDAGGQMDADTVLWWLKQDDDTRGKLLRTCLVLPSALQRFNHFLQQHGDSENIKVWGNGASFDLVILRNAFTHVGSDKYVPWQFFNERDVRTVVDMGRRILNIDPKRDVPFEGVRHSALADAVHQAKYVSHIWQALVRNTGAITPV